MPRLGEEGGGQRWLGPAPQLRRAPSRGGCRWTVAGEHWLSLRDSFGGHVGGGRHTSLVPLAGSPHPLSIPSPHPTPTVWPQLGGIRARRPVAASPSLKNVFVILAAGQITVTNGQPAPRAPSPSGLTLACRRVPWGPHPSLEQYPLTEALGQCGQPQSTSNLCRHWSLCGNHPCPQRVSCLGLPHCPQACRHRHGHWPRPQWAHSPLQNRRRWAAGMEGGLWRAGRAVGLGPGPPGPARQRMWSTSGGISDRAPDHPAATAAPRPSIIPREQLPGRPRLGWGAVRSGQVPWAPAPPFLSSLGSWRWAELGAPSAPRPCSSPRAHGEHRRVSEPRPLEVGQCDPENTSLGVPSKPS